MTFPRIEMENSKINDKISIRDKIIDHEQELEEKALEINENMINPYEDFMLDFENRQGLKSEFKTQINLFENNYNR